jgi:5'-nucleotidase
VHILIANDDGYDAPGLLILANALRNQHHKVTIVAPRVDMSGCGMGISLRKSINVEEHSENYFVVDGTPADCVYIGLQNLANEPVDMVVSGINNGPNLADDILYSGTFAAAMEARHLRLPSISLSITQRDVQHYETAAYIATALSNALPHLDYKSLISVLNVNVPDVPVASLRGLKATVLGERLEPLQPIEEGIAGSKRKYRLAPAGEFDRRKRSNMADFEAVEQGYVSITPLSSKFEDRSYLQDTQAWLDTL